MKYCDISGNTYSISKKHTVYSNNFTILFYFLFCFFLTFSQISVFPSPTTPGIIQTETLVFVGLKTTFT